MTRDYYREALAKKNLLKDVDVGDDLTISHISMGSCNISGQNCYDEFSFDLETAKNIIKALQDIINIETQKKEMK